MTDFTERTIGALTITERDALDSLSITERTALITNFVTTSAATITTSVSAPVPDTTPPEISNVGVILIEPDSVMIEWDTDEPANCNVTAVTTYTGGYSWPFIENMQHQHYVLNNRNYLLQDLEPSTVYYFKVKSIDQYGNEAVSDIYGFRTASITKTTTGDFGWPKME